MDTKTTRRPKKISRKGRMDGDIRMNPAYDKLSRTHAGVRYPLTEKEFKSQVYLVFTKTDPVKWVEFLKIPVPLVNVGDYPYVWQYTGGTGKKIAVGPKRLHTKEAFELFTKNRKSKAGTEVLSGSKAGLMRYHIEKRGDYSKIHADTGL